MAALAFVRTSAGNTTITGGLSVSSGASAITAGNRLFVFVAHVAGTSSDPLLTPSVSDTAGNVYIAVAPPAFTTSGRGQWFYVASTLGHASNVITATWNVNVFCRSLRAFEFSGDAPTSIAQVTKTNASASALSVELDGGLSVGAGGVLLAGLVGYASSGIGSQTWTQTARDQLTVVPMSNAGNWAGSLYALTATGTHRKGFTAATNSTSFSGARVMLGLAVDIGGAVPADVGTNARLVQAATEAITLPSNPSMRNAQTAVEAVTLPSAPSMRHAQTLVEVLWVDDIARMHVAQLAVEVIRPNAAVISSAARPHVFVST